MKNKFLKRATAFFVCSVFLMSFIPSVNAAWDGYPKPTQDDTVVLVDNNNISKIFNAKAKPSAKNVKSGERYSAHWNNHTTSGTLSYTSVERDWSMCDKVSFDVYSEKATNAIIAFMVYADYVPTPGKTISYFLKTFKLDFEGWKHIEFNTSEFKNGNYADWAKINKVEFIANGWGATPNAESDIYISSVYGEVGGDLKIEDLAYSMNLSDKQRSAVYDALNGSVAVMDFAGNIIKNGKTLSLEKDERITTDESGSIATISFYENVLDIPINTEDKKITVAADKKIVDLTEYSRVYDGVLYLPLHEVLGVLGRTSEKVETITLIGNKSETESIAKNSSIINSLKIILNENLRQEVFEDDWRQVKDKWRKYILGDETINLGDEKVVAKLQVIDRRCDSARAIMNKNNSVFALFGDKPVTTTSEMSSQYTKLNQIAKAYGTYGCVNYKKPEVKKDILYGLKWLNEHLYGQKEIDGNGWSDMHNGDNWWDWYVGVPAELCEIMLVLEDDLNPQIIKKYLAPFEYAQTFLRIEKTTATAASRVYACTLQAALLEDLNLMKNMTEDYNRLLAPSTSETGVQEDGLYITHEFFPYTAAYGCTSLLDRLTKVQSILRGTAFEFATPYNYNSCKWMYDTFAPITFNGAISSAFSGRFRPGLSSYSETGYMNYVVSALLDFIGVFGKDDDVKLKQLIKRNVIDENISSVISGLEIGQVTMLQEILADTSIEDEPYYNSRVFYTGDSVAHQRDDFGFALSMSSSRIAAWESIQGVNMTGWYQGDGMLYTYVDSDPLAYGTTFWKKANPYHLPGTTVDTQERVEASIKNSSEVLGKQDFVGGASIDNLYSVAAMQLQTHNNENKNANVKKVTPGGDAPYHKSSLIAKKAYFMFDDEAVALGTDVNANDGFEVQTVVENRLLNKKETIKLANNTTADSVKIYDIVSVNATGSEADTPAENTLDGNLETRWSASGDVDVVYELSDAVPIGYVGIAQYHGTDGKQAIFELETSLDGKTWTKLWEGKASGTTEAIEAYDMKGTIAKYVKYSGHGRTNSEWNTISEFKIFAPSADGSMNVGVQSYSETILGSEKITVDGQLLETASNYKKFFTDPKWVHLEGTGGYFFPLGGELVMDKVTNTNNFLEMWVTHGVSPNNGSYAYVLLPKKTAEETSAYAKNSDIEILSNTEKLQVVREKTLGVTGMVFWQAGSFEDITTSQPIIAMAQKQNGEYKINISDPTHLLKEGKITVNGNYELLECDERLSVISDGKKTEITINFEGSKGRTLPVVLKVN